MQNSHLANGLSLKVTSLDPGPAVPCAPVTTHDLALSSPLGSPSSPGICPAALKGDPPPALAPASLPSCPAEYEPSFCWLDFRAGEPPRGSDAAGMRLLLSGLSSPPASARFASAGTCARRPLFCAAWALYQRCLADEPYLHGRRYTAVPSRLASTARCVRVDADSCRD
jgi:hypothetical protein